MLDIGMRDRVYHRIDDPQRCKLILLEGGTVPMATLRKSDMAGRVASKLQGSKAQGEASLNAVLDSIQDALSSGDRVVLTGFGSFEVRQVKARKVRPIRGGQAGNLITVPACKPCNQGSSIIDEEFRTMLSLKVGPDTPVTGRLWQKARRGLQQNKRLKAEIIRNMRDVELRSPGGIILGTAKAGLWKKVAHDLIILKITRGLFFTTSLKFCLRKFL